MLKAIIIEDAEQFIVSLKGMLQKAQQPIEIIGAATTLKEGRELIASLRPTLVFLDIGFEGERKTAFDMLHEIQKEDAYLGFHIIFITGQGTYENKTKALKVSDLKMLHKPYDIEDLVDAIEDVLQKIDPEYYHKKLNNAIDIVMRGMQNAKTMIALLGDFPEEIFIRDIVMIEVDGKNSNITLTDKRVLQSSKNVAHYEKRFEKSGFIRVHNQRLINEYYFRKFIASDKIELTSGEIIVCSVRGYKLLQKKQKENPESLPNYEESSFIENLRNVLRLGRK